MKSENAVHLSVVAVSRNDDHGENLLGRMQHFVSGFLSQCHRHQLNAELILVEWNPPADKKPLSEALHFSKDRGPASVRIITVPAALHATLEQAEKQPLFQMMGKNVGIQRARGKYILATNIDILFSDEIIHFMKHRLKPKKLYRADRMDVPAQIPATDMSGILNFCREQKFRISGQYGTCLKVGNQWQCAKVMRRKRLKALVSNLFSGRQSPPSPEQKNPESPSLEAASSKIGSLLSRVKSEIKKIKRERLPLTQKYLHGNACGDFTLLSKEEWLNLRGYAEWKIYSWHIDNVFLYHANHFGITEIDLPREFPIYHIEHSAGSGYTPENSGVLFSRLKEKSMPHMEWSDLVSLVKEMKKFKKKGKRMLFNEANWGFSEHDLPETIV